MNSVVGGCNKAITIPEEFFHYAERHQLYEFTQVMDSYVLTSQKLLRQLIIDRPADPIEYLIEYLDKPTRDGRLTVKQYYIFLEPSIYVFGPKSSGLETLANLLSIQLKCVVIDKNEIYGLFPSDRKPTPKELASALKNRLKQPDCEGKGHIVVGFPTCESEAKALGWEGIHPEYAEQYDLITAPPPNHTIESRLVPLHSSDESIMKELERYAHDVVLLKQFYNSVAKVFNADQHLTDIYSSVLSYIERPRRTIGLRTPRVLLLGLLGSGRKTQAKRLVDKYGLVMVDCGQILKLQIIEGKPMAKSLKNYMARGVQIPDSIVIDVVKQRLQKPDCSSKGWILIGYPRSKAQAELLDAAGLAPDRVFILHISEACAAERITGRRTDMVTGIKYHEAYKPHPQFLSDRAAQNPDDECCVVTPKLARFTAHREELMSYYQAKLIHVDAALGAHTVFEQIEDGLVNPLPRTANKP